VALTTNQCLWPLVTGPSGDNWNHPIFIKYNILKL